MNDIQTLLKKATSLLSETSSSPALDAEVLLSHVMDKPRAHLRAWPEKKLDQTIQSSFAKLLEQRHQGHPIAYLIGQREFWSREFMVDADVLIPRPDTELLIELALSNLNNKANARILDLGTGTGIIAITLAAERPDLDVYATDICLKALAIAKKNAFQHNINNIHFIHSNWFEQIVEDQFDLIISNPPYIAKNDPHLAQGDLRFEPKTALVAENQGLKDINTLCDHARRYLKPGTTLLIEHGYNQENAVKAIFQTFQYQKIKLYTDLSGTPRVTAGECHSLALFAEDN